MAYINRSEFQIVLPSNASALNYPNNIPANFKTKLAMPIQLVGEWEMAIVDIQYSHSWINIKKAIKIGLMSSAIASKSAGGEDPKGADIVDDFDKTISGMMTDRKLTGYCYRHFTLPAGYYGTMSDICDFLTKQYAIALKEWLPDAKADFTYNENTNKVSITGGQRRVQIFIADENFQKLTGIKLSVDSRFTSDTGPMYATTNYAGEQSQEASRLENPTSMYIYSDICEYQLVGDSQAPLLGILPIDGQHKQQRYWSFVPPYYIGVTKSYLSEIELRICTDTGDLVPFTSDSAVVVRIHFRKKAAWMGI